MKRLLFITLIITSSTVFSQEKGPVCSKVCYLKHLNETLPDDFYGLSGNGWNHHEFNGLFQADSTDSSIAVITLLTGDSLVYHGGWIDWGPCISPDLEVDDVTSVITIVEGEPFPVTAVKSTSNSPDWDYSISQDAVIRSSCLLGLKAPLNMSSPTPKIHFVRVVFIDTPVEAGIPDELAVTDLSVWLSTENTLSVGANNDVKWDFCLYSLSGQVIQTSRQTGSQDVDVSQLSRGCYVAIVSSEDGVKKQLKFVR